MTHDIAQAMADSGIPAQAISVEGEAPQVNPEAVKVPAEGSKTPDAQNTEKAANNDAGVAVKPEVKPVIAEVDKKKDPDAKPQPKEPGDDKKPSEPVSKGWAAISRKEAAIRKDRAEFKNLQDQTKAKMDEAVAILDAVKEDPIAFAEKHGATLENWTKRVLNDGKKSPEEEGQSASRRIAELEKKLADRDKNEEKAAFESEALAAANKYYGVMDAKIAEYADKDFVKFYNWRQQNPEAVRNQTIELVKIWKQNHGEILTAESATVMLMKQLEKEYSEPENKQQAAEYLKLLTPHDETHDDTKLSGDGPGNTPSTLTNQMSGTQSPELPDDDVSLTRDERIKNAAKLIPAGALKME